MHNLHPVQESIYHAVSAVWETEKKIPSEFWVSLSLVWLPKSREILCSQVLHSYCELMDSLEGGLPFKVIYFYQGKNGDYASVLLDDKELEGMLDAHLKEVQELKDHERLERLN